MSTRCGSLLPVQVMGTLSVAWRLPGRESHVTAVPHQSPPSEHATTQYQGRKYATRDVAQMLVDNLNAPESEELHASLSERELQTLQKIASGKKLSEIAEELMLSPKTVSLYRARVLERLHLANNAELKVYAIRNSLV